MSLREVRSAAKSLLTPSICRRGAVFSALVLVERLLVPATAWSFFRRGSTEPLVLAFAVGIVFTGRTFVQHAFRAATEIDLMVRVASRLIGGDVLRANALRDEDARAELGQAMYHAAQNVSVVLPLLLADLVAAPLLVAVVIAAEPTKLLGVALAMTAMAGALLYAGRRSIERALDGAWTAQQEAFASFMDALDGRLEVVASGQRAAFLLAMHRRAAAWRKAGSRVAAGALVSGKLPFLSIAVVVAIGVALASAIGRGALGVTTADVALLASMTPAFSGIAQDLFALARTERWMGVVARALSEPALAGGGGAEPPQPALPIAFERVFFSYEGARNPALRGVSFAWGHRGVLALTGPNGSGKSTCLRLLMALASPQSGAITVGGAPLERLDADAWRREIAYLPQRPYLPPASDVGGAIRFLARDARDDTIRDALDRVGLGPSLARLSADPLSVRVGVLSVGERQRVGVARLLCQGASLVLLDEPDANLDRAGILLMASLVRHLAQTKMVALVAHNPELLDAADRILVLDQGRLVEDQSRMKKAK